MEIASEMVTSERELLYIDPKIICEGFRFTVVVYQQNKHTMRGIADFDFCPTNIHFNNKVYEIWYYIFDVIRYDEDKLKMLCSEFDNRDTIWQKLTHTSCIIQSHFDNSKNIILILKEISLQNDTKRLKYL